MAGRKPGIGRPGLTPELVMAAYARGIFPMADSRDSAEVFWVDPRLRGVLPLDGFHMSRSLRRRIRRAPFHVTYDRDFAGVIAACADREETWINEDIVHSYHMLHLAGHAHSIEMYQGDDLVGGVYGVVIGAAFFGESMFSRAPDASKVALAYLVEHLAACGFVLFDTQFITPHLSSLGGLEIPREIYRERLAEALTLPARFDAARPVPSGDQVVQRITQTS